MFTTVKGGKTTFADLSASLFQVAPLAATAGVSFQEVNAALQNLTLQGVPTSVATTQVRAALQGLLKPSEELDGIFRKAGFKDAAQALEQDLGGALNVVFDATKGDVGELTRLVGSIEGVSAILGLAGPQAEGFAKALEDQTGAAGATATAFAEIDKSRDLERLKVTLDNLAITVGTVLLPIVEDVAAAVLPWIQRFAELDGEQQKLIVGIAAGVAALGPLLRIIGNLTKAVSGLIKAAKLFDKAFTKVLAKLKAVGRAALRAAANIVKAAARMIASAAKATARVVAQVAVQIARWVVLGAQATAQALKVAAAWLISIGPILLIGAAIAALVALVVIHWDTIVAATKRAWDAVTGAVVAAWEWIKTAVGAAIDFLVGLFLNFTLPGLIIKHWDTIRDATTAVVDWIKERFADVVGFLAAVPGAIASFASGMFNAVLDNARTVADGVVGFFRDLPGRIGEFIGTLTDKAKELGGAIVGGILESVSSVGGVAADFALAFARAVRDFIDDKVVGAMRAGILKLANLLADINIPGAGRAFDAASASLEGFVEGFHLPKLHRGGLIPGQPGEDVLLIGKAGERVSTPGQDRRGDNGAGMVNNFYGITRPRQVTDELAWQRATGGRG
jgi:hypothetical protein